MRADPESRDCLAASATSRDSGFDASHRPGMTGVKLPARLLPFYRLPADIPAAESIRPFDAIDRLISAPLRFGDGLACRADVQHAAAIGENGSALRNRTRYEDYNAPNQCP